MATNTTNYKLKKPALTDSADVTVLNENFEKIDAGMNKNAEKFTIPQIEQGVEGNLVFFHNPDAKPKRVVVYCYNSAADKTKSSSIDFEIPARQCTPVYVYNGHFGLYNTAEDTNRSTSITLNKLDESAGVYRYDVDKCGAISVVSYYKCLTGDTLISMANGPAKRLDEIEVGDTVLSIDWSTMENVPNKVIYTDKDDAKEWTEYDRWTFSDGTTVKTVHAHEFYNVERCGMTYMHDWKIGEHAVNMNGEHVALVSRETIKETVNHYKITLENGTNYFANGLLTGDRYCPKGIKL